MTTFAVQRMAKDKTYQKIIIGIDPGTTISGYGVIGCDKNNMDLIAMGIIDLRKEINHSMKLQAIYDQITKLMVRFLPDEFAIEAPFYGKNPQSMLKLGRAQGVAIAAALNRQIPIFEYAPRRIKQSVTGSGSASKEQVAGMVKSLLKLETLHSKLDATDAVAIAICHHFVNSSSINSSSEQYSGWESFVKNNPGKLK